MVPKQSLTGESTERVDTRVLQVLYSFDRERAAGVRRAADGRVHRGGAGVASCNAGGELNHEGHEGHEEKGEEGEDEGWKLEDGQCEDAI